MKSFFEDDFDPLHPQDDDECCDVHFPNPDEHRDAFLEKDKVNDMTNQQNLSAFEKYSQTAKNSQAMSENVVTDKAKEIRDAAADTVKKGVKKVKKTAAKVKKKIKREGVTFNSDTLVSVLEDVSDAQAAHIDTMLTNADLLSKFDNICPVSGSVFDCMKAACANPENLKIACSRTNEAYIEAQELLNFCEANGGINLQDAVDMIAEHCVPGLTCAKTHVVFPSECSDASVIGVNDLGLATGHSWSSKLINGCLRYGLVPHVGVEVANENAEQGPNSLGDEGGDRNSATSLANKSSNGGPVSLKDVQSANAQNRNKTLDEIS